MSKKFFIFDSDALKKFHKRIFFSIVVFCCCFFLAIFRIADIMLIQINKDNSYNIVKKIERGKIYDRNGYLLSSNLKTYSLAANASEIKNKSFLSKKISKIINIDSNEILKKLKKNNKNIRLKKSISPSEHQKINNLGEINLITKKEIKRVYPFRKISSHLVGFVNDGIGKLGVERGFENQLKKGEDVYLTIDINLQTAVRQELINTINKFSADSGLSIIMDITNGEILSLNSFPDFDPNNRNSFSDNNLFNRVLQANYEMGSTFKPITVAMGIDQNIIKEEMTFDVRKPIKGTIHDYHPYNGYYNVKEIVVNSSNIGTAKIAEKIGKKVQIDFFKKIGFYEKFDFELKESAKPLGNKHHRGEIETMTIGYGHGFAVTPLHLITAYASLANNGIKIYPKISLVKKVVKKQERIVKKETAEYFLKLLRAVILETKFTGKRVKIPGYEIGGKTGTADLNKRGKYIKDANLTSFIGVFPISDPKFAVLSIIENPKKIKAENNLNTGAVVNAPLVKKIILRMIEILHIPKIYKKEILNAATSIKYSKNYATF